MYSLRRAIVVVGVALQSSCGVVTTSSATAPTAAISASPVSGAPLACTHPGWSHHWTGDYAYLLGGPLGIRTGTDVSCGMNGVGNEGDTVSPYCYLRTGDAEREWVFLYYGNVRAWLPARWIWWNGELGPC